MVRIEGAGEAQQGMILAVEPEYVAVDHEKRIVQQRQGPFDTTAGVEELGLIRNLHAGVVAPAELRGYHRGLVMDIDDDALDPGQSQSIDRVIEQGAAVYLDERFRNG